MREYTDKEWEDWKADPRTEQMIERFREMAMGFKVSAAADVSQNVFHNATLNVGRAEGVGQVIYLMEKRP